MMNICTAQRNLDGQNSEGEIKYGEHNQTLKVGVWKDDKRQQTALTQSKTLFKQSTAQYSSTARFSTAVQR